MATVPSAPLCADGVRTTLIAGDGVRGGGGDGATGTAGAADSVAAVTEEYAHGSTTRALNVRTAFILSIYQTIEFQSFKSIRIVWQFKTKRLLAPDKVVCSVGGGGDTADAS